MRGNVQARFGGGRLEKCPQGQLAGRLPYFTSGSGGPAQEVTPGLSLTMGNLEMILTDKHTAYENECRQMFMGQTIHGVIYGELKYFDDEAGNNVDPEPYYKTEYLDIDTLDHSIYFRTDNRTIYSSFPYGSVEDYQSSFIKSGKIYK